MIRVVNKKTWTGKGHYIGRPTALGNPFSHLPRSHADIKVATRDESISRYRGWLLEQLDSDNPASRMFLDLLREYEETGELTLICWCKPLSCHGDILAEFIREAAEKPSDS